MPHPPCYWSIIRIAGTLPSHSSVTVDSQVLVLPTPLHDFLTPCLADADLRKSTLCFIDLICGSVAEEVFPLSVVWSWDGGDWPSHSWCISASLSSKCFPFILLMMPGHANYSSLDWFSVVWDIRKSHSEAISWLGLSEMTSYKLKSSHGFGETNSIWRFLGLQPLNSGEGKERRMNNKLKLYVRVQDFLEDSPYKLDSVGYDSDNLV